MRRLSIGPGQAWVKHPEVDQAVKKVMDRIFMWDFPFTYREVKPDPWLTRFLRWFGA